jgi:glyoxylase-like metal-dependent hydrolase (beta-lactamase superfamily II)
LAGATLIDFGSPFAPGLTAIPVDGAAVGEIAIHWEAESGTMVIGDALINFEPYGFTFLPSKYCSNFKLMRASLRKLLDYSFERMLFSHGEPILSHARERLEALLEARP